MTTRRSGALLFLATVFTTQTGYNECTGDVLHDPGFDIWCGDELCSWDIEKGDVRKVFNLARRRSGGRPCRRRGRHLAAE